MLKKILFLLFAILLISCTTGKPVVKDSTLVYKSFFYDIYKIKIDSSDYLIAITDKGVSIIKK